MGCRSWILCGVVSILLAFALVVLGGCLPQQADLKDEEPIQSIEGMARIQARQGQEIASLREQELPRMRGELDRAIHQLLELRVKLEDLSSGPKKSVSAEIDKPESSFQNVESRLDSHDELLSSIMVQLSELTRQVKGLKKH